VPSADNDKIPTTQAVGAAIQDARVLIRQEIQAAASDVEQSIPDAYTKAETNALLAEKQDEIDTVNVTVGNTTGTPSGSASVSGSTLSLSFQNLKGEPGAAGAAGAQGPQGVQGPQGPKGDTGVTGDASSLTIIHGIDKTSSYGTTDVCGADAAQALLNEI